MRLVARSLSLSLLTSFAQHSQAGRRSIPASSFLSFPRSLPYRAWVEGQLPEILRRGPKDVEDECSWAPPGLWRETGVQARVNILCGACLAIGLRFAGSASAEASETLTGTLCARARARVRACARTRICSASCLFAYSG